MMKNQMEEITKYKVVLLGDESVGKTSIVTRLMYHKFDKHYQPTIGIDFLTKTIYLNDLILLRLQIWDTAGQERFRGLIPSYIKDSSLALIVYDVTNRQSFLNTDKWIEQVHNERGTDVILVLVGNKSDLVEERQVSTQEGDAKARAFGVMFLESSAKVRSNTNKLPPVFRKITAQLLGIDSLSSTKQEDKAVMNLESSSKTSESDQLEVAEAQEAKRKKNNMMLAHQAQDDEGTIESLKKRLDEEKSARVLAEEVLEKTKIKGAELEVALQAVKDEKKNLYARLRAIVSGDSDPSSLSKGGI